MTKLEKLLGVANFAQLTKLEKLRATVATSWDAYVAGYQVKTLLITAKKAADAAAYDAFAAAYEVYQEELKKQLMQ